MAPLGGHVPRLGRLLRRGCRSDGLWDYEGGGDPQEDWDNLDQVLTAMEGTGWIRLTTMSEYLAGRYRPRT